MIKSSSIVQIFAGLSLVASGTTGYAQPDSALAPRQAASQLEDLIRIDTYVIKVSRDDEQFGAAHWSNTLGLIGTTFALTGNDGSAPQNQDIGFLKSGFILEPQAVKSTIRTLIQRGKLRSINSPVIYTRTGVQVQIRSVKDQTILLQPAASSTTPYIFTTGLTMDVVPQILRAGIINLKINLILSAQTGNSSAQPASNTAVPIISIRSATADVQVIGGQAAVIGGITLDTDNYITNGIPGLRKIPLLGYLFNTGQKNSYRTNIVIIVRPQIVKRAVLERNETLGSGVTQIL